MSLQHSGGVLAVNNKISTCYSLFISRLCENNVDEINIKVRKVKYLQDYIILIDTGQVCVLLINIIFKDGVLDVHSR